MKRMDRGRNGAICGAVNVGLDLLAGAGRVCPNAKGVGGIFGHLLVAGAHSAVRC